MADLPDPPSGAVPTPAGTALAQARIGSSEQAEMAALVARMRTAAREAGIDDDGPLTPLLEAIMLTLDHLGTATDRNERITTEHAAALTKTLGQARQSADAEAQRFYARLEAAKAETVRDIAQHIARSADAALTRRVRVFDRNTALIAAAILVGSILGAFGGGYWRGSSTANAAIHETETGLQAAFNQGSAICSTGIPLMVPPVTAAQSRTGVASSAARAACPSAVASNKTASSHPPTTKRIPRLPVQEWRRTA
jgi:hypothetical protein